jgi:hypothetical protein
MDTLTIRKAICQIRYPPAAILLDRRGQIAAEWYNKHDLTEWRIGTNRVESHNKINSVGLVTEVRAVRILHNWLEIFLLALWGFCKSTKSKE